MDFIDCKSYTYMTLLYLVQNLFQKFETDMAEFVCFIDTVILSQEMYMYWFLPAC